MVNGSQVVAAGFASAAAAFVTSRFGVAGTLLGAAITAMIITGGSALLKAYFESMTGHVRKVPDRFRARRERRKAARYAEPLPDRPDLRDNFAGRMRAAVGWFSHLPPLARRSILVKGLIAAVIAFLIGMTAVWGVERVINNSFSCGFWGNCPPGAEPGVHLVDRGARGAGSTFSGGRAKTQAAPGGYEAQDPSYRRNGGVQQDGAQQEGFFQQAAPDLDRPAPRGSDARPGGVLEPDQPAEAPAQPQPPSSASPAPEQPVPGEVPEPGIRPQDASPAPAQ